MVDNKKCIKAAKKILAKFKDSEIISIMQIRGGFLFSIKPKNANDYTLDGFFKVDDRGSIIEYSPVMNPKEFKEAMNNVIYTMSDKQNSK